MPNNVQSGMSCEDVRRRLRPFLEDLLSESEHRGMSLHLETCPVCEKYIRSIADLANQIWKLGKVPLPSDLADTALFKLRRYVLPPPSAPKKSYRKIVFIVFLLGLTAAGGFYRMRRPASSAVPAPISVEAQAQPAVPELTSPASAPPTATWVSQATVAPVEPPSEESAPSTAPATPSPASPAAASGTAPAKMDGMEPLHWHIRCDQNTDQAPLCLLQQKLADAVDHSEASRVSQPSDLVVLKAEGAAIGRLLGSVAPLAESVGDFEDFTPSAPHGGMHPVSIYLDKSTASQLHWHLRMENAEKQRRFLDAIRELGGKVDYDEARLAVLSVPRTELKSLRLSLKAMGIEYEEYGASGSEGVLTNAAVTISVFWGS